MKSENISPHGPQQQFPTLFCAQRAPNSQASTIQQPPKPNSPALSHSTCRTASCKRQLKSQCRSNRFQRLLAHTALLTEICSREHFPLEFLHVSTFLLKSLLASTFLMKLLVCTFLETMLQALFSTNLYNLLQLHVSTFTHQL